MPNDSGKAACYVRSSKDRSDISPQTQLQALEKLAASRSLSIVETFEDAVESGSAEDRPGFERLRRAINDPNRGWRYLLVYDTSRIARRRYIAQAVKHQAKKRGVVIVFASMPADMDAVSELVLESVFEAFDEAHSLTSRKKGLAGMAENVRQGWRAGGRAPHGYQLKSFPTGAIREGRPVTKTKLEPGASAHQVRSFLKARVSGVPRGVARVQCGLTIADTSLIGMEWNALTYAGHTVWNVHREAGSGSKRRPRAEWHIKRDTHEALITEREAETILAQLETSDMSAAKRRARAAGSRFLLSGLLYSTDGRSWLGHGAHYRLRKCGELAGRIVPAQRIEAVVIETLQAFRTSDDYLAWLLTQSRHSELAASPGHDIRGQIRKLERERLRAAELSVTEGAGDSYARVIETCGRKIAALTHELEAVEREVATSGDLRSMGVEELREYIDSEDPAKVVRKLVARVVLEPTLDCQIRVRQASYNEAWRDMASPKGFEGQPQGVILRPAPGWWRLAG